MFCEAYPFFYCCNLAVDTFRLQQTQTSRKMFTFECSAIVGSLPEKVCNKVIWLTKHFYENHFIQFSEDVRKTTVMKVLENYQKNIFSSVLFKKFELSNLPIYNYSKNWFHRTCVLCILLEFSKLLWERLWCNHFLVK